MSKTATKIKDKFFKNLKAHCYNWMNKTIILSLLCHSLFLLVLYPLFILCQFHFTIYLMLFAN